MENGDEQNSAREGNIHDEFEEEKEVKELISRLSTVYADQISTELVVENFTFIVDKYQEQPHLLDPHLECLLNLILDIARKRDIDPALSHLAFKFLYLLTKMRGLKIVLRLLPHEVADMEPVLALLTSQDPSDFLTWETRYMLLLWLSIVCMIPFDMSRLDSNAPPDEGGRQKEPTMMRIMNMGKMYLKVCDKTRDAAALMISKFLTRHDVKEKELAGFMDWCLCGLTETNRDVMSGMNFLSGILSTLASLFKLAKREDVVEYAPIILEKLVASHLFDSNNTQIRKLTIKLVQRLGLTFLSARMAAWRYQRGSRSLADNLQDQGVAPSVVAVGCSQLAPQEEQEEYDVPEEIEAVIEQLLVGLRDKDTIVRWSAAKGVGRMTGRLPQELADEVVGSVLELFSFRESDGAWHGGCLALAELGRRGLLLPERLPEVVPVVLKALAYDEKRGSYSVGSHVRDAACYVCWAFARAYEPTDMERHVGSLASALVITTIFDREVNCRKAAAAAFQENVGRQGTFPHGIEILTTADYFAVGNRTSTYLNISCFIADFEEYTIPLIDHLASVKTSHWDSSLRELTAQALHKLTAKAPDYMIQTVLPSLIPLTTGIDIYTRHGALLAAAEVTHALHEYGVKNNKSIAELVGASSIEGLKGIIGTMLEARMFRGMAGEVLRPAACVFIEKMALSKMPFHGDDIIDVWQSALDDNIVGLAQSAAAAIQTHAARALTAFCEEYYRETDGTVASQRQDKILDRYLLELNSSQEVNRMGAAMAIGNLPRFMVQGKLYKLFHGLIKASTVTSQFEKFAEARRDAITALTSLCKSVGVKGDGSVQHVVCSDNVGLVYSALLAAMKDYATDSRGDVGAWVREASMTSLCELTSLIVSSEPGLITPQIIQQVIQCLVQQAAEKIDRTRVCAGAALLKILHHDPEVPHIPCRGELLRIFPRSDITKLNWSAPSDSFPKITQLLDLAAYRHHVLLGLIVSVGGLTESLVRHSSQSLLAYIKDLPSKQEKEQVLHSVLELFSEYEKIDRVTLPLMKMIDILLANGSLEVIAEMEDHPYQVQMLEQMKKEISKCADVPKLLTSIDVYCGMILFSGETRRRCLGQLTVFLCHRYPKVRKVCSNKLYETLLMYDDVIPEENQDEVLTILSETKWDDEIKVIRPIRNQLCDLMNIPKPQLKNAKPMDTTTAP